MIEQNSKKDTLFTDPARRTPFEFDHAVTSVFDDMIGRSVPFYPEILNMIVELSTPYLKIPGVVLDLGCSTGNMIQHFSRFYPSLPIQFYAVDVSEAMLSAARQKLVGLPLLHQVEFLSFDLEKQTVFPAASVIVLNLVLQFTDPETRLKTLKACYDSLLPGGALFLVEKLSYQDTQFDDLFVKLYYNFKRRQGYSEQEILNKEQSLKGVLRPFTLEQNKQLLEKAGFDSVEIFFKWYNFSGMIATKSA